MTRAVLSLLPEILEKKLYIDPKSRFQESAQEHTGITPTYRVHSEEGPDHEKVFTVGVYLEKERVAEGLYEDLGYEGVGERAAAAVPQKYLLLFFHHDAFLYL